MTYFIKPPRSQRQTRFQRLFFRNNKPTKLLLFVCVFVCVWYVVHPPVLMDAQAANPDAVIEAAKQVLGEKADSTSRLWETYFFPASGAYLAVVYLASVVGAFLLITLLARWMNADEDVDGVKMFAEDLIWVSVLLIALAFNGQLFSTGLYIEKTAFDGFIKRVDTFMSAQQRFQEANAIFNIDAIVSPQIKACEGKVAQPQIECLTEAYQSGSATLDKLEAQFSNAGLDFAIAIERWRNRFVALGEFVTNPEKEVLDKVATSFWTITSPAWEGIVKAISSSFSLGVFNLIDCLTIFLALVGPMAAALSVLPVSTYSKVFFLWQTGMLALFAWKFILIVLDAISSELLLSFNADLDTLWFGFVTGLLFPLISVIGVAFGSLYIFQSIASIGNRVSGAVYNKVTSYSGGGESPTMPPKGKPHSSNAAMVR